MNTDINQSIPPAYTAIDADTKVLGFNMASDSLTCALLRTLAATKPGGNFLELGTGSGLSTAWILDGMDANSTIVSIDNDGALLNIAQKHLAYDARLTLQHIDGAAWVQQNSKATFDFIFADTWHGKYLLLNEVLDMLTNGGLYIIDDMLPQPNWPEGHEDKVLNLVSYLEQRPDFFVTKLNWASGIIIATKK